MNRILTQDINTEIGSDDTGLVFGSARISAGVGVVQHANSHQITLLNEPVASEHHIAPIELDQRRRFGKSVTFDNELLTTRSIHILRLLHPLRLRLISKKNQNKIPQISPQILTYNLHVNIKFLSLAGRKHHSLTRVDSLIFRLNILNPQTVIRNLIFRILKTPINK